MSRNDWGMISNVFKLLILPSSASVVRVLPFVDICGGTEPAHFSPICTELVIHHSLSILHIPAVRKTIVTYPGYLKPSQCNHPTLPFTFGIPYPHKSPPKQPQEHSPTCPSTSAAPVSWLYAPSLHPAAVSPAHVSLTPALPRRHRYRAVQRSGIQFAAP